MKMQIRRLLSVFLLAQLALALLVTGLAIGLYRLQAKEEHAQQRRYESFRLAEDLRQSSDDLTRFARTYAATGDERFARYYQDVLDIRNGAMAMPAGYGGVYWDLVIDKQQPEPAPGADGARSLEQRMIDAGFTLAEFSKLQEGENESNALVRFERVAMNAVKGKFDDDTGAFTREGAPDKAMALEILYSPNYNAAKARIMEPIGDFMAMVDRRTGLELERLNLFARRVLVGLIATSTVMLLGIAAFVSMLRSRVLRSSTTLIKTVREIAGGNLGVRTGLQVDNEIGELGRAIDTMAGNLEAASQDAKRKAEEIAAQTRALDEAHRQSEKLLHNILPAVIADRLQKGESMIAETFPEVTILFADIVGFTALAARLGPVMIVNMLNDIFGRFDDLAAQHGLEKIKTIGDCYMLVGGIPDRSPTHCQQVAEFALAALESFKAYSAGSVQSLSIRIGIHTGTVVAGIVGKQKFSYDLWGDVVNTASRYESTGAPDRIHVSEGVKIRLADDYEFEDAGEVKLKGVGSAASWFLVGRKEGARQVVRLARRGGADTGEPERKKAKEA
jgi:adenylate cyclase